MLNGNPSSGRKEDRCNQSGSWDTERVLAVCFTLQAFCAKGGANSRTERFIDDGSFPIAHLSFLRAIPQISASTCAIQRTEERKKSWFEK